MPDENVAALEQVNRESLKNSVRLVDLSGFFDGFGDSLIDYRILSKVIAIACDGEWLVIVFRSTVARACSSGSCPAPIFGTPARTDTDPRSARVSFRLAIKPTHRLIFCLSEPAEKASRSDRLWKYHRSRCETLERRQLASRLNELESRTDLTSVRHATLAHSTHVQLKQLFDAIRHLMEPPPTVTKQPMGFVVPEDKPAKLKGK